MIDNVQIERCVVVDCVVGVFIDGGLGRGPWGRSSTVHPVHSLLYRKCAGGA
jgi:hypothetical protein